MHAVVLGGLSRYGAFTAFSREIAQGFVDRGDRASFIDFSSMTRMEEFYGVVKKLEPADLVFSINILGEYRDGQGRSIGEIFGCPHILQLFDYPLIPSNIERLSKTFKQTAILTVDRSFVADIAKVFGPDHFPCVRFFPHGGTGQLQSLPADAETFVSERPIRMLFTASYYPETPLPWNEFPEPVRQIFSDAAEIALSDEWVPILEAIDLAWIAHGVDPDSLDPEWMLSIRMLAFKVQEWVRFRRRRSFLEAACAVGMPLTVYGEGYADVLDRYPNIDYRGVIGMDAVAREMGCSQICFNATAIFGAGSHDRVFSTMLAGAVASSDYSTYFAEEFVQGREIAMFRWRYLEEDLAVIQKLSENPQRMLGMAKAGQRKTVLNHSWKRRVETIIEARDAVLARAARTKSA